MRNSDSGGLPDVGRAQCGVRRTVPAVKSSPVRSVVSVLAFAVFVGLTSVLGSPRYQGLVRVVLAMISGAALMVALRTFAADVRDKR